MIPVGLYQISIFKILQELDIKLTILLEPELDIWKLVA